MLPVKKRQQITLSSIKRSQTVEMKVLENEMVLQSSPVLLQVSKLLKLKFLFPPVVCHLYLGFQENLLSEK